MLHKEERGKRGEKPIPHKVFDIDYNIKPSYGLDET